MLFYYTTLYRRMCYPFVNSTQNAQLIGADTFFKIKYDYPFSTQPKNTFITRKY
ncbi:conserved domain protein [Ruminococcus albus 8]|uniref:Conserved domain protein n=1 Tax=Ruminococcus albus 8 TaxID=246199 RepID=E9SBA1_RUMAL|nr:conserved domain protein [Ruminococcus albus 8]